MLTQLQKISINKPKIYLLIVNIFLVFSLIILNNLKILPLHLGDFLFFAFLALALALYRPGWCFLLFVGTLMMENINLAPIEWGINIRPYQFIGAVIILALAIRFLTKRLSFKLIKPVRQDWLVIIFALSGFLSIISSSDKFASFKLSIIMASFVFLYFLARNYIQSGEDLKRIIPFFISSSVIVIFYGIWQNWRFLHNLPNFEVMPGRPNATFTEPDWLGMFLILLMSVVFILIYYSFVIASEAKQSHSNLDNLNSAGLPRRYAPRNDIFLYIFLILTFILLIISVSRSAWLGTFVSYVIFVLLFFTDLGIGNLKWKETSWLKLKIISSLIAAILIIYIFHLTNFQLANRAQSAGTGLQKITISCANDEVKSDTDANLALPEVINGIEDLEQFNCRHIKLEDINAEKAAGKFIKEVFRRDPNVNTRAMIYQKSWQQIKNHPVLGIGWGNINNILGKDGRGTLLNSSNIFLETWLGAGIIGFLSLVILLGYILIKSIRNYHKTDDNLQKAVNLFIITSWFGLIVANLFNAGIFLGIFWIWLGISNMDEK